MPHPLLIRLAAYGSPAAVAAWRQRVLTAPGLPRLSSDPVVRAKYAKIHVATFAGSASADLHHIVSLTSPGVNMIALRKDHQGHPSWVHIVGTEVTDLGVPQGRPIGFLIAHRGKFRHTEDSRSWDTAASAIAAYASPLGGARLAFIAFDIDGVWTPATRPAPEGTQWVGGALDATDLALGEHLYRYGPANQFPWQPWTVDVLSRWLDHIGARAYEVPVRIAATAGLPAEELADLLAGRHEPASQLIRLVRTLHEQGMSTEQLADVIPGLLD